MLKIQFNKLKLSGFCAVYADGGLNFGSKDSEPSNNYISIGEPFPEIAIIPPSDDSVISKIQHRKALSLKQNNKTRLKVNDGGVIDLISLLEKNNYLAETKHAKKPQIEPSRGEAEASERPSNKFNPTIPLPILDELPKWAQDLARVQCWFFYYGSNADGTINKRPMNPVPNWCGKYSPGSTNIPNTCGTFAQAYKAAHANNGGIGILLGTRIGDHALVGIDVDTCFSGKQMQPWAQEVLERFYSYTEISPSGTGFKIFALTKIQGSRNTTSKMVGAEGKHPPAVDIFFHGKYFTLTGQTYEGFDQINYVSEADCDWLVNDFMPCFQGRKPNAEAPKKTHQAEQPADLKKIQSALDAIDPNTLGRPEWFDVTAALHSVGAHDLRNMWDVWCARYKENDLSENETLWGSLGKKDLGENEKIKIVRLFWYAKERGWVWHENTDFGVNSRERYSDLGNAHRLTRHCDGNIGYVHEMKSWFNFDGKYWKLDTNGGINRLANETIQDLFREADFIADPDRRTTLRKFAIKSESESALTKMVSLARHLVPIPASELDADPFLLGVKNGVVDLRTGIFRKARREDFITKQANVAFDPIADCPHWREFQNKICGGDKEVIAFKQRMWGATLSGRFQEALFIMFGNGANGKSTEAAMISDILGDYSCTAPTTLMMAPHWQGGSASPEIVALKGKRAVFVNETADGDVLNEARVKNITSNEKITGRALYKDLVTFEPSHKAFLLTNHKPRIRGTDYGIWRRIFYIPYTTTIGEDEKIEDFRERLLMPEASGILNWMLAGWLEHMGCHLKFQPPEVITAAAAEYKREQNTVRQFVEKRCHTHDPKAKARLSSLYGAYSEWMSDEFGYKGRGRKQFSAELVSMGFSKIEEKYCWFSGIEVKLIL